MIPRVAYDDPADKPLFGETRPRVRMSFRYSISGDVNILPDSIKCGFHSLIFICRATHTNFSVKLLISSPINNKMFIIGLPLLIADLASGQLK